MSELAEPRGWSSRNLKAYLRFLFTRVFYIYFYIDYKIKWRPPKIMQILLMKKHYHLICNNNMLPVMDNILLHIMGREVCQIDSGRKWDTSSFNFHSPYFSLSPPHSLWDKVGQHNNGRQQMLCPSYWDKFCEIQTYIPCTSFWKYFSPSPYSVSATSRSSLGCFAESLAALHALRAGFGLLQQMLCDRRRHCYLPKALFLLLSLILNLWYLHQLLLHAGRNETFYTIK